jgi:hypothetical protein
MNRPRPLSVLLLTTAATLWSVSMAADGPGMGKDLGATIALQGQPCDKVVDAKRNGDSDYTATCKDGNRYHVFVNPQGRVVVQKL